MRLPSLRRRRPTFTGDNFRAFSLPIMIRDPLADAMVAVVDGAAVRPLGARRGSGGTIIIGEQSAVSSNNSYKGYLSGWINVGAEANNQPRPYLSRLPAGQGPVAKYNTSLELLRRAGAMSGALRP